MDPGGAYSNTMQVRQLHVLMGKLPSLNAPVKSHSGQMAPRRSPRLAEEQTQQLVKEYKGRATVYELGEKFGISRQMVGKILKRHGVTMRRQGLSPDQVDEAVQLYDGRWSLARIGEKYMVDPTTVIDRLRERGVRMRDTDGRER